jgi:hypothetical protein
MKLIIHNCMTLIPSFIQLQAFWKFRHTAFPNSVFLLLLSLRSAGALQGVDQQHLLELSRTADDFVAPDA